MTAPRRLAPTPDALMYRRQLDALLWAVQTELDPTVATVVMAAATRRWMATLAERRGAR